MANRPIELMQLYLTEFGAEEVLGIYGEGERYLASRMRFLHPTAAVSFLEMNAEKTVRCSDMLRTPEGSLNNRRAKGAGLRPGWSGHNYGFSIDIETAWMLKTHGFENKAALDQWMASHGWYCHNPPGETRGYEAWHYNYFGDAAEYYLSFRNDSRSGTWHLPVSKKIEEYYGHWWENADDDTVRACLRAAGYDPAADLTPSVKEFQNAWDLSVDGVPGPMTKRTLLLVSSDRILVGEVC